MNIPMRFRIVLRKLHSMRIDSPDASPDRLCERLSTFRTSDTSPLNTSPQLERVLWIQGRRSEPGDLITFAATGALEGLQFAIRHILANGIRIFQSVILLNTGALASREQNGGINTYFGLPRSSANRWLGRTRQLIDCELRGLLTEFSRGRAS